MTKLFSVKSLAFAGAAAFALTLAAAPQADAAEAGKAGIAFAQTESYKTVVNEDGEKELVFDKIVDDVNAYVASILVSKSAVTISDGKLEYYYSSVKTGADAKKYKAVSTSEYWEENDDTIGVQVPVGEIAKGKAADVYIAADAAGKMKTNAIKCNAAPKVKATIKSLSSGPSIEIKVNNQDATTGNIEVSGQYNGTWFLDPVYEGFYGFTDVKSLVDGTNKDFMNVLQEVADFGGATLNLIYYPDDDMTPYTTVKLKVAGVPTAPKLGLKISKAFTLKLKNNIKYRTFVKDADETGVGWETGDGSTLDMETLFGKDNVTKDSNSDEYVLNNNMILQTKTFDSKGKKLDSRINTTTIYASAATPSAVNAVITNNVVKNVTNASITFATTGLTLTQAQAVSNDAVAVLEYKAKGDKKWTVAKDKAVTYKNAKLPDEIYVRVQGVDESTKTGKTAAYEASGHIMTIKIDKQNPEASTYATTNSAVFVAADAK